MDKPKVEALKIELLDAIKHNQFVLYYQPQFNVSNGMFEGVEALIRWQHPSRGLLLPSAFLPVTEETGYIVRIGEWVLRTACQQNKAWQEKGLQPIRVAVNIAAKQFQQKNFVEMVMKVLQETQLKPKYLELELTENIVVHDETKIIHQIQRLKNLGISIALDDFGTGYSSISLLKKIPVDRIKIDRTFIENINNNPDDATIVRAVVTLAEGLRLQVLAEGVESLKQLQKLLSYECKEVQGFYFSEPLPASEVEKYLRSYQDNTLA